jgi:hypothetical protein
MTVPLLDELSALPPTDDSCTKGRAIAASGYAVAVVRARRNEVGLSQRAARLS